MTMQLRGGSTVHFSYEVPFLDNCSGATCFFTAVGVELLFVAGLVLSVVGILATFDLVAAAKGRCRTEYERTQAEIEAYTSFSKRVGETDAGMAVQATTGPVTNVVDAQPGHDLRAVEDAYRETVMATAHYEEEYGDPLYESLAADFGHDTAEAIRHNRTLSPQLKATLIQGCQQAVGERQRFLRAVDGELEDLNRSNKRLAALEADRRRVDDRLEEMQWGALSAESAWEALEAVETGCDDLAATRQDTIHTAASFGMAGISLHEYLYGSMTGPTYPVLAEVTGVLDRLSTTRDALCSQVAWG